MDIAARIRATIGRVDRCRDPCLPVKTAAATSLWCKKPFSTWSRMPHPKTGRRWVAQAETYSEETG